ncbi:MAG TPA: helicase C-terminal domain-containing protein [bacterium]|jgi:ATP-dependent DNA helicase DinG|nr:helicase C-terminal domain-containing protein [bacterium]
MNVSQKLSSVVEDNRLENRPQQNLMASAVEENLVTGGFLMVEAGTGVGKSFAYLLPAIEHALKQGGPVVVSTHTLTLQEQLFQKDLPLVLKAVNEEGLGMASALLMKGRGNYLSRRRLKLALENNSQMDIENGEVDLVKIQEWSLNSAEGTLAALPFPIKPDVWGEIKSDPYHCLGSKCPTFDTCFFHSTRRKAGGAHLILVNHALLLADLALKMEEAPGVLPNYDVLIVDEAHHLPAMATEYLGASVSFSECMGLVKRLLYTDEKTSSGRKGLFTLMPVSGAGEAVMEFKKAAEDFFTEIGLLAMKGTAVNRAYLLPEETPDIEKIAGPLKKIQYLLELAERSAASEELGLEARGTREECRALVSRLSDILDRGWGEESCYVVEPDAIALRRGEVKAASVKAIPIDASSLIREHLLTTVKSVIFTSATLSVGNDFGYFKHALGLDGSDEADRVKTLAVGSPFNYKRQVTLFLPRSMPHPRREEERYVREVIEYTKASLKHSHGKAFVLFTSNKMMRQVSDAVRPLLDDMGITLLVQGEDGWDRTKILKVFREDINSVLFGVNSFWEGVDVPGEALSNLIITKLPFQVPEGPLVEARHARLKEQGLEPFAVESLPEAVLRLKQGFGRLIRTATDVGTVTLLDPRVTTERWGRVFLNALPECDTVYLAKPGTPEKASPRKR